MKRNHNLDILRIIAMMMIIIHHITYTDIGIGVVVSAGVGLSRLSSIQLYISILINSFVVVGVNLFFLLSGYFRINFKVKKVVSIIAEVFIIFNLIALIGILTGYVTVDSEMINKMINPLSAYWFLTVYIFLMFLSPYLNKLLDIIDKKDAKKIMLIVIIMFSIYGFVYEKGLNIAGGYSLIWAILMYVVGGIISKFKLMLKSGLLLYIITSIINAVLVIVLFKSKCYDLAWSCFRFSNILVFASSVFLLLWFNSLKEFIKNKKLISVITFLAMNTMMVYLIHTETFLTTFRKMPITMFINHDGFRYLIVFLPIYALLICFIGALISYLYKISIDKLIGSFFKKEKKNTK